MKHIRLQLSTLAVILGIALTPLLLTQSAYAEDPPADGGAGGSANCSGTAVECIGKGQQSAGGDKNNTSLQDNIKIVTNVLLFLLGAVAVIMIILGGIRYATSNGDASNTKAAKDTILYAVVGLVVAILAYAIVNFIVTSFVKN